MAQASPLYFGGAKWQDPSGGLRLDIAVFGFDPQARPFIVAEIENQTAALDRPETVLVDSQTRPLFGPLQSGRVVELNGRRVTIGGDYVLGTGFLGLGVVLANEAEFLPHIPEPTAGAGQLRPRHAEARRRPGSGRTRIARSPAE